MTPAIDIDRIFGAQRRARERLASTTAPERIEKIRRLEEAVLARRDEIRQALHDDMRKPPQEVDLTEIYAIVSEARFARRRLRRWMRARRVSTPIALFGSRSRIVYEPKGVVLILSPWNFPFNLTLAPLVSAIAAGNAAILKPSELTPASSSCMRRIVTDLFPEDEVVVIEGDVEAGKALVAKPFDHIFFTGSTAVGREVMKAAAANLTSVTLEMGGKSPAIVDRSADVMQAAERIVWGKFLNAGQVCIAPDYVIVDEQIHDAFVAAVKRAVDAAPPDGGTMMVNEQHAARVNALIDSAVSQGATIVTGGRFEGRQTKATVITGVPLESAAMSEEIFGPLLPIVPFRSVDEALQIVSSRGRPLVLYLFARDRDALRRISSRAAAGATVVNHTLIHFYQLNLPFGGVGESGIGRGHGFFGFEAFSNSRAILEQRMRFSPIQWLVPPYSRAKNRLIDFVVRYL
ncbi:MAG TPA: aldehyde dehydrogenase family protein [Thermoanaerobaculia bacterium]|nr:aldehyde dehydrogenase family protein [Thermoanaerobaculia bacterium]